MFTSLFSVFSAFLLGFSYLVNAAPAKPVEFLAFAPSIIQPNTGAVWVAGTKEQVAWKTDNVPPEAQNYTLTVLLGNLTATSENLDISKSINFNQRARLLTGRSEHPLATYVPIMNGSVVITVPNTTFGTNYIVAGEYLELYQLHLSSSIPKLLVIPEILVQRSLFFLDRQPVVEQLDYH